MNCSMKDYLNNIHIPIITASRYGHIKIVKLLIQYGAQVNVLDIVYTPLHVAVKCPSAKLELIELLLQNGADPELKDWDIFGTTPLMNASTSGNTQIAKVLLDYGAKADSRNDFGRIALSFAKTDDMIKLLISATMPHFIELLQPVANKWRDLGKHLGMNKTTLNRCQTTSEEEGDCLQAMMTTWSKQENPLPTCEALIRAVKSVDTSIAKRLQNLVHGKYCLITLRVFKAFIYSHYVAFNNLLLHIFMHIIK